MTTPKFEPGDTVRIIGGKDELEFRGPNPHLEYFVLVSNGVYSFDIRSEALELVRKAKRMVKKSGWVNLFKSAVAYPTHIEARTSNVYRSKSEADKWVDGDRVACVEIHWEEVADD